MGKTQKKRRQDKFGYRREVARRQRLEERARTEKRQNYYHALTHTQVVPCQCARCNAEQTIRIENKAINLVGDLIIGWCGNCGDWRIMTIPDRPIPLLQPPRKEIITACKVTGMRYRFENHYAILTGRTVRWYVDYASVHKNAFFCSKHSRIWGKKTNYKLFYNLRKVSAADAIIEIGAYEKMLEGDPVQMTKELRDAIQRERLSETCEKHGFNLCFKEPFACISTGVSDWRFDYHREKVTLLHRNNFPVLDKLTGVAVDYHVQYADYDLTVEQVIDGIAGHDEWHGSIGITPLS